jgi:hypothetical protein
LHHRRQQRARQPYAGHHVGLPVVFPDGIVGVVEILRAINPGVIDQNIDAVYRLQQLRDAFGAAEVGNGGRGLAPGTSFCRRAMASFTLRSLRPLTTTSAPLAASPLAIAKPIPAVEAVTSATFPENQSS